MNPTRYILTRSCLQDGTMRLLKFNESAFPESGAAQFVDDRGKGYAAYVNREQMRVEGLGELYHDHNLSVNDVLTITPAAPGRYEVAAVVKPYSTPRARQTGRPKGAPLGRHEAGRQEGNRADTRREPGRERGDVPRTESRPVGDTPSVREVRAQAPGTGSLVPRRTTTSASIGRDLSGLGEEKRPSDVPPPSLKPIAPVFAPQVPQSGRQELTLPAPIPAFGRERTQHRLSVQAAPAEAPGPVTPAPEVAEERPAARPQPGVLEDQIAEFARLTGYRLTLLGHGLIRLNADLGPAHSYSVLLATEPMATTYPAWDGGDEHRALVTAEEDRAPGIPRLTREALVALTEHARLAPLGALDLRGYWRAGDMTLESAASIAELVSQHLAQRGALTYVLLTLSQQPAQSVFDVNELAQRLGSGVSLDDMHRILDTLTRPPFLALTPLPNGQFLLRTSVADLLADLADYAQGVRRRLRAPASSAPAQPLNLQVEPPQA